MSLDDAEKSLAEVRRLRSTKGLFYYKPYPKQRLFHEAGANYRERLFLAGNQLGKTLAGAMEVAMHATGRYPSAWKGYRFERPIVGWVSGPSGTATRDNPQRMLLGRPESWGTGAIPAEDILETTRATGVTDLLDNVRVRHASGGESWLFFKSYEQSREKWQGETIDLLWPDEEPPPDLYSEGLTRTQANSGLVFITATPLLGMTEVIGYFYPKPNTAERFMVQMEIEEAEHYTEEQRAAIIAGYRPHEREARARGIPMLGSGRIFPVPETDLKVHAFQIPDDWPRLGGMDFGWEHPFAAVEIAHNRDEDVVYVTKAYTARHTTPVLHAAALKPWGDWLPWAWPRDGRRDTLEGAGVALKEQYEAQGLNMLDDYAQFEDGSVSLWAGLTRMHDRMQTGRFKVFAHLEDWFREFRAYHQKEGVVVKENEDLMCATRYAEMMLREAETPPKDAAATRHVTSPQGWMGA